MSPTDMKRKPSDDPAVHRDLVVVDKPMLGRDVANLNRATHARLKARGLSDDVPSPTHDKFTYAAALAAIEASYFLGLRSQTYLATDHGRRMCSEGMQAIIRDPTLRSKEQRDRANARSAQIERGPRYYDGLARAHGVTGGKGVDAALAFAAKHVGITEHPAGSNRGPTIDDWIRLAGYEGPVPWCGCAANAVLMAGGIPNGRGWIGYTPAIVAHAKAGTGGWSWHGPSEGRPGDLALYDDGPGGDIAVHVETVKDRVNATTYNCYGGNTSPDAGSGSQANGGGFWLRHGRSTQGGFRIIGFARPPWPS